MQRLSPEKSLDPQQLLRQAIEPPKPPPRRPRNCSKCGCDDRIEVIQGEFDGRGESLRDHWVTIELRYLKRAEDLTRALRAQGWREKDGKVHQGKLAMERFICRPCMRQCAVMEREWQNKRRTELRTSVNDFTYYQMVCEETLS